MVRLGDIAEIRKGRAKHEDPDGDYLQVTAAAIDYNGRVNRLNTKKAFASEDDPTILRPNDVLLTVDGTTDNVALIKGDGLLCGSTCILIRPRKSGDAYRIFSHLRSYTGQEALKSLRKGDYVPHLNIKDIRNIDIP